MNHPVPEALHFIQPLCPECDTNYPMRRTNVCADCYAGIKPWKPARKR